MATASSSISTSKRPLGDRADADRHGRRTGRYASRLDAGLRGPRRKDADVLERLIPPLRSFLASRSPVLLLRKVPSARNSSRWRSCIGPCRRSKWQRCARPDRTSYFPGSPTAPGPVRGRGLANDLLLRPSGWTLARPISVGEPVSGDGSLPAAGPCAPRPVLGAPGSTVDREAAVGRRKRAGGPRDHRCAHGRVLPSRQKGARPFRAISEHRLRAPAGTKELIMARGID